jgi:(1->4)-alpha-D-glucan 1-alpha-D-glucosylmutase
MQPRGSIADGHSDTSSPGRRAAGPAPQVRIPRSTYRVQVGPAFDLHATAGLVDYLAALGVTALYASPLLAATPGSAHGYDVVDHSQADPQRGGERGRQALVRALRGHGLGLVLDLVPNHVGVTRPQSNPAWWDLLRLGPESAFADWFDVDWSRGRLLLPVLADGPDALDKLAFDEDGVLRYDDLRFPLAPGTEAPGSPREVHDRQHYELVPLQHAAEELNYRRFFAVSTLAALRVEDPGVYAATHAELLRWVAEGQVDGLRVDHPDGLTDPLGYLQRLRAAAPGCWLVVEKILEPGEELPASWPVDGTTGYDALAEVDSVLVDPAGAPGLTALDRDLVDPAGNAARTARELGLADPGSDWAELVYESKMNVATGMLRPEVRRLTRLSADPARLGADAGGRTGELAGAVGAPAAVEATLAELLACFPVYRSYLPDGAEHLAAAIAEVHRRRPDLGPIVDALAPRLGDPADQLAVRFQQTSGAVMAKGVEDEAYYRWTRFIAANEVGGDPSRIGLPLADFHAALARRQHRWPAGMTTLSTHDTKRSEDVRARLAVLAEVPDEWAATVRRWSAAAPTPDAALGHLLWQTVAGAWPLPRERLRDYLHKAMREANTLTSWADPNPAFESAMHAAADTVYDSAALHADIDGFVTRIAPDGWSNSLTAKLLQLAMPGVPDVYQGCELWDYSLVDPDNRRPVDFTVRRELLARLDSGWLPPVDATGAAKLLVVSRVLRARRDHPDAFTAYTPLAAAGPAADHAVAFDRGGAIAVGTRLPIGLRRADGWQDSTLPLPPGPWIDTLTGTEHDGGPTPLTTLLAHYPVALLLRS